MKRKQIILIVLILFVVYLLKDSIFSKDNVNNSDVNTEVIDNTSDNKDSVTTSQNNDKKKSSRYSFGPISFNSSSLSNSR